MRSVEESKGALWSERAAPKGSSNMYGGVDDTVRNGHPSNSDRWIPTLSQNRQRELIKVLAGFEYTTYIYSIWSMYYLPIVIM